MTIRKHHQVLVSSLPDCDLCKQAGRKATAHYDGKTIYGPWAYMCKACFKTYGVGGTGEGVAQELVVRTT